MSDVQARLDVSRVKVVATGRAAARTFECAEAASRAAGLALDLADHAHQVAEAALEADEALLREAAAEQR